MKKFLALLLICIFLCGCTMLKTPGGIQYFSTKKVHMEGKYKDPSGNDVYLLIDTDPDPVIQGMIQMFKMGMSLAAPGGGAIVPVVEQAVESSCGDNGSSCGK